MGLFDGYFDPEQFQDSGGLLGRLVSLQQQQGQYQPPPGFNAQSDSASTPTQPASIALPVQRPAMPQAPDAGPLQTIAIGDYQMPQFGRVGASPTVQQQPAFADRLTTGFQSWAHTPLGNPVAGLANGMAGFGSGQRTDPAGVVSSPSQAPAQTADLGDRFRSGLQSLAHTPVGNPFAALANGLSGFGSGRRSDPAAIAQPILTSPTDAAGDPQSDPHARYEALRQSLGDRNAMLAIVNPEVGQSLIARALARQTTAGTTADAEPASSEQPGPGYETNSTVVAPSGPASTPTAGGPHGNAVRGAQGRPMTLRSNMPRARKMPPSRGF